MRNLYILVALLFATFSTKAQTITISEARAKDTGQVVTIQGIVTNGSELGNIRYVQDATGGLPAFQNPTVGDFASKVKRGDKVTVTGKLKNFNNLLEIDPINSYTIVNTGNTLPTPKVVLPSDMSEAIESQLLKFEFVTFSNQGENFKGNTTYTVSNGTQSAAVFVRNGHPLVGKAVPLSVVHLTGICSQFKDVYQLLPRDENDIVAVAPFYITKPLSQTDLTKSSITVNWTSNKAGTGWLLYGTSAGSLSKFNQTSTGNSSYTIELTGLNAAGFYYVQGVCTDGKDTAYSNIIYCSSVSNSSGNIKVYFNKSVDTTFSVNNFKPDGIGAALIEDELIKLINAATSTIDVSLYNCSRPTLITALSNAAKRGVRVRYVTDIETFNSALNPTPTDFKVMKANDAGLMHNKYFIIDANSEQNSWVVSGSMNFTTDNMADDFNNTIFIQDQALAKAYELETDEMWGGKNANPNVFSAVAGANKKDNTPHRFKINGFNTYLYFSPTDGVTNVIVNEINKASSTLEFAVLTYTQDAIGTAMVNASKKNVTERGMIENVNDQGSEYTYLQNNKVNVKDHKPAGLLHHKYLIRDAALANNSVLTGSHNWSGSAETQNDENTLLIENNPRVANLFKQEFEQRWKEVITKFPEINQLQGVALSIKNPSSPMLNLSIESDVVRNLELLVIDMNGKQVFSKMLNGVSNENQTITLPSLTANYVIVLKENNRIMTKKLTVVSE